MRAAGMCLSILALFMYVLSTVASISTNFWVGAWTEDKYDLSKATYIWIYIGLGCLVLLFVIIRAFILGTVSKSAALNIYETINWNILRRPMRFFDTSPSGVILNRCINDVNILDFRIPWLVGFFLNIFVLFFVIMILTAILSPVVIIAIALAVAFVAVKFKQFVMTTTELKRLTQLSAAPMISLASEFIQGVTTIRNYGKNKQMLRKYVERADRHHSCDLHEQLIGMWMRSKMEWSMACVTAIGIFSIAVNKEWRIMTLEDSSANGLVISYLLSLGAAVSGILFTLSNLAKGAVSIERLKEYATWEDHERDFDNPEPKQKVWPSSGAIEAQNVTVRYRRGLKKVLDGVDFKISSGQKVAIVGRTGSGKSTLLLSLMRILEMEQEGDENFGEPTTEVGMKLEPGSGKPVGKIVIDGQDIDQIGLHHLRGNLAIIPQEPFLLQGTLKFNVDPFNKFSEDQIITALKSVSVLDTIRAEDIIDQKVKEIKAKRKKQEKGKKKANSRNKTAAKKNDKKKEGEEEEEFNDPELTRLRTSGPTIQDRLSYSISTGGSNLSLGQRQLICIARTILVPPKILLMDEATANIDQKTDSIIQSLIKKKLEGTTVVTIAHRLITICQYDKLIILDEGKKSQEGTILQLLGEPEQEGGEIDKEEYPGTGIFANLVNEGGEEFREKMIYCARHKDANPAEIFG
jgi:ABC-type multidrug transport system fused ATPase/permease subunit